MSHRSTHGISDISDYISVTQLERHFLFFNNSFLNGNIFPRLLTPEYKPDFFADEHYRNMCRTLSSAGCTTLST